MKKWELINDSVDRRAKRISDISDAIWDSPELAFSEETAVKEICASLEEEGFRVEKSIAGISTAFSGTYGSGKPVIGILGEYDALSGLSQKADCPVPDPVVAGASGHGCGHNLLGAGSLAAAIAVKDYLKETGKSGTVIYYGCPGEEGGSGKGFMARGDVFKDLDCAITWHPAHLNSSNKHKSLSNMQLLYSFEGVSSHASGCPELGRSALDAVTLMNTGVQFLREHISPLDRIHYAVLDTGGTSPNVVQASAKVLYLIRTPELDELRPLVARVDNIARGAALMTDTKLTIEQDKVVANMIPNGVLQHLLYVNMEEAGLPEYTDEEYAYAKAMEDTVTAKPPILPSITELDEELEKFVKAHEGRDLNDFLIPEFKYTVPAGGSTDVGDVSWNTPTAELNTVTISANTAGHTWQVTAQGKSSIAHKGMLFAGKAMAGAIIDLIDDPTIAEAAKKEWESRLNGRVYEKMGPEFTPRSPIADFEKK